MVADAYKNIRGSVTNEANAVDKVLKNGTTDDFFSIGAGPEAIGTKGTITFDGEAFYVDKVTQKLLASGYNFRPNNRQTHAGILYSVPVGQNPDLKFRIFAELACPYLGTYGTTPHKITVSWDATATNPQNQAQLAAFLAAAKTTVDSQTPKGYSAERLGGIVAGTGRGTEPPPTKGAGPLRVGGGSVRRSSSIR